MTSFAPFYPKYFFSSRCDLGSSVLVVNDQFRLQLDNGSLDCALNINLSDPPDAVACFDVLLLWQFGFLMLERQGHSLLSNGAISIYPFGFQPGPFPEEAIHVASFLNPLEFSLRVPSGCCEPSLNIRLAELADEVIGSSILHRLHVLRSHPSVQHFVAPLLDLNPFNRLSYLAKYAFCRSPSFNTVTERLLEASLAPSSDHESKGVTNVSPTSRQGAPASLRDAQDLVRLVFRKVARGIIPLIPPVSTFRRATPSPGGLATCEAFLLHGFPETNSSLLYYDSESDFFVDCCSDATPVLQKLARHVHRESMLNCQSDDWAGTVLILSSDLWTLERKYGTGAFSLACLEVGIIAEAVHNQLSSFQLAGCLCGSLQAWPLLALAHPERRLLPMMGYSLMQL